MVLKGVCRHTQLNVNLNIKVLLLLLILKNKEKEKNYIYLCVFASCYTCGGQSTDLWARFSLPTFLRVLGLNSGHGQAW